MNYYHLRIKSTIRVGILLVQSVPQGQPLLFEFWNNLASHLKRSLPNSTDFQNARNFQITLPFTKPRNVYDLNILRNPLIIVTTVNSVEPRQRSLHLFRQIDPNSQILMQYAG